MRKTKKKFLVAIAVADDDQMLNCLSVYFCILKKNICEKSICTLLMRNLCLYLYRSRKRRTSYTQDEREYLLDGDDMDECNAALVLMSLSCSPNSPRQGK